MVRKTYKFHNITIPQANDPTKTISKTNFISPDFHDEGGMIGFLAPDATLVSDLLSPVDSVVVVRGESGSADELKHILYSSAPDVKALDLLWLQKGAEAITLKHNAGSAPSNAGPLLLLSQVDQLMPDNRMTLLQRQGNNFQEIAFNGIVGNGGILVTDDAGKAIIVCGSVASAVNYLKVTNSATGNNIVIEPAGTDTDIGVTIQGKGAGLVKILSQIITNIYDANGLKQLVFDATASAVNFFTMKHSATGNDLEIQATGTDTDIGVKIVNKGAGITTLASTVVTAAKRIQNALGTALGTTGTIDLDFSTNELVTMPAMTDDVTFTFSNLAAGRTKTVRIIGHATLSKTITLPSGTKLMGLTSPITLAATKYAIITFTSISTTDAEVVAAYAVQP